MHYLVSEAASNYLVVVVNCSEMDSVVKWTC